MAGDPFVASSGPIPISAQPDLARNGWLADDFLLGGRRRDHHDAVHEMTLVGGQRATE